jgi:hypothetical protein
MLDTAAFGEKKSLSLLIFHPINYEGKEENREKPH